MASIKNQKVKMEDAFEFEIGVTYKNMKGAFEVLSIENESMVIRWDDGLEVATTVDVQKRIMERMAYERDLRQQAEQAKQEASKIKPKRKKTSSSNS